MNEPDLVVLGACRISECLRGRPLLHRRHGCETPRGLKVYLVANVRFAPPARWRKPPFPYVSAMASERHKSSASESLIAALGREILLAYRADQVSRSQNVQMRN